MVREVPEVPDMRSHLEALHARLTPEYKQKHKVEYNAMTVAAKSTKFEFTIGETINDHRVGSFTGGICEAMFGVRNFSGLKPAQKAFVDHLVFMLAQHSGIQMHNMKPGEKFKFDFTAKPTPTVIMWNRKGEVVIGKESGSVVEGVSIEANAITIARERFGEHRMHIDAEIRESLKDIVDAATRDNNLHTALETFVKDVSLANRKRMLQGLDTPALRDLPPEMRSDIDTIDGINKYLRLQFEVEQGLTGEPLEKAMDKHRVNPDGTNYKGLAAQNRAWVMYIRFDMEVGGRSFDSPFTSEQARNAMEVEGVLPGPVTPERVEPVDAPEPVGPTGEVVSETVEPIYNLEDMDVGSLREMSPEERDRFLEYLGGLDVEGQIYELGLFVEEFLEYVLKDREDGARGFYEGRASYEFVGDELVELAKSYPNVYWSVMTEDPSGRTYEEWGGDVYDSLVATRQGIIDDFEELDMVGEFLDRWRVSLGRLSDRSRVQEISDQMDEANQIRNSLRGFEASSTLPTPWDIPEKPAEEADLDFSKEEIPSRFEAIGLPPNANEEYLDQKIDEYKASVEALSEGLADELKSTYPDFNSSCDFRSGLLEEGALAGIPYYYVSSTWSSDHMGSFFASYNGRPREINKFARVSGLPKDKIYKYLAYKKAEDAWDGLKEGVLSHAKEAHTTPEPAEVVGEDLEALEDKARENLDLSLRSNIGDFLRNRVGPIRSDKIKTVTSYGTSFVRKKEKWKGYVNVVVTFEDGVEPQELTFREKMTASGVDPRVIPITPNEVVDLIIDDVDAVLPQSYKPSTAADSSLTPVEFKGKDFDRAKRQFFRNLDIRAAEARTLDLLLRDYPQVESISLEIPKEQFRFDDDMKVWRGDLRWEVKFTEESGISDYYGQVRDVLIANGVNGQVPEWSVRDIAGVASLVGLEKLSDHIEKAESAPMALLEKFESRAITGVDLPKYTDVEFTPDMELSERQEIQLATLDQAYGAMINFLKKNKYRPVESKFRDMEAQLDMKLIWSVVDRQMLSDFYTRGAYSARELGDDKEVYRRLKMANKLDPENQTVSDWINDIEQNYVQVKFKASSLRADTSPFDVNHRSSIEGANEMLQSTGKFEGYLPKLRGGNFYIVDTPEGERRLDIEGR